MNDDSWSSVVVEASFTKAVVARMCCVSWAAKWGQLQ